MLLLFELRIERNIMVYAANGSTPMCCDSYNNMLPPAELHPQCLPIPMQDKKASDIERNGTYRGNCMNFVRSKVGLDYSCTLGHAEQVKGSELK